ncbi:hypothetical protein SYNPS1DRAFT_22098 [Syncephalis pseudoplumigaleata]|uniref:Chitin-binding type-4 domain-containing protein n=1 Tax=Syncephalis pseudoplumigaleata TaxID=1712513 RepID=A0A4P9Z0W5_9FUNG|nr:hypothetical protein SYNPS1DRAFT_22098 [Syncephalis pseudoplumigaleata]|eukprot:RKP26054.1 hypothetical protein SYNPS1DRAFT_22098 [Syncephalis pseudoplumigaleata]
MSGVSAHGYMSSPPIRGNDKISYKIDDIKNPNTGGQICRGEPAGKVTNVGHEVTLGFTITAPHVGPCTVYILDENLGNSRQIATKNDCAAPGKVGPWTITIPSDISGRKVIRWYWEAEHVTPHEFYENCADVMIEGGSGGSAPAPETGSQVSMPIVGSGFGCDWWRLPAWPCSNGTFVWFACAQGTTCTTAGDYHYCGFPKTK